jgi:hypothetical protein
MKVPAKWVSTATAHAIGDFIGKWLVRLSALYIGYIIFHFVDKYW